MTTTQTVPANITGRTVANALRAAGFTATKTTGFQCRRNDDAVIVRWLNAADEVELAARLTSMAVALRLVGYTATVLDGRLGVSIDGTDEVAPAAAPADEAPLATVTALPVPTTWTVQASPTGWAHCPNCKRDVPTAAGRYNRHLTRILHGDVCTLTDTAV